MVSVCDVNETCCGRVRLRERGGGSWCECGYEGLRWIRGEGWDRGVSVLGTYSLKASLLRESKSLISSKACFLNEALTQCKTSYT